MRKKCKSRQLLLGASMLLLCAKIPSYVSAEELFGDGEVFFSESEKVAEETTEEMVFDNFSEGGFTDVFETPEEENLFMEETGIEEFEWSDSPKLTTINCPKPLDEISVPELRNCGQPVKEFLSSPLRRREPSMVTEVTPLLF